jgi:hypothetical protein
MAGDKKIIAYQGKLFKVVLGSNFGSTNIGWCLTSLPKGIALLAEGTVQPAPRLGAPVQQVFSFTALDEVKDAKLEFRLIKHVAFIGKEEQLETVEVEVEVVPYNAKSDVSRERFVEYSENTASYSPEQDNDCTQVLKYGYPPYMKYGYPVASAAGVAPCPSAAGTDGTVVYKYGYPAVKYGYPGAVIKYGYPPEGTKADCEVVQDDCGCYVVKYGYPAASAAGVAPCPPVAGTDGTVVYKYGYPAVVKYGYPGCQG